MAARNPPASSSPSHDIFPFERLPPELRNAIYEHHFTTPKPITIYRKLVFCKKKQKTDFKLAARLGTVTYLRQNDTALLRLNKATHSEALPSLYGANGFVFDTGTSMAQFLSIIGPGITYLTSLAVQGCPMITFADIATQLKKATRLQSLRISNKAFAYMSAGVGLQDFYDGLYDFVVSSGEMSARRLRFDMLCLDFGPQAWHVIGLTMAPDRLPLQSAQAAEDMVKGKLEERFVKHGKLQARGSL